MNREERLVVRPLVRWFMHQKAAWRVLRPRYGSSATGWDIEARRNKMDLLIEAKYIDGPFLASFGPLVAAPLAHRPQRFMKTKYRGWAYHVCWAIGTSYRESHIHQILLDYLARNLAFWSHYKQDLRLKYVFFVRKGEIARIRFSTLLKLAKGYQEETAGKRRHDRLQAAAKLTELLRYKRVDGRP